MKSHKEWIPNRAEDLALQHHKKFYTDLPEVLQQNMWAMASRQYVKYCEESLKTAHDRMRDEISDKKG